jgi:hypothetical protein
MGRAKLTMTKNKLLLLMGCLVAHSGQSVANEFEIEPAARYRFQKVNDNARGDAQANTLKVRLNASWRGTENWQAFAQADHVHAFNDQDYNSVAVTRATSPIADVEGSELNQAWIKYTSDNDWFAVLGRQLLNFDNERHISSAEFWQNDQTFDAITLGYNDSTDWQLEYSYINKVHRLFGDDATSRLPVEDIRFTSNPSRPFLELGNHQHDTHLLNVNYAVNRYIGLTGYAYLIDNETAAQLSSDSVGIRLHGAVKPNKIKFGYTAEFAKQKSTDDNPWNFAAQYMFAELSAQFNSHQIGLSHERLSEDNGFAFATTLGNNHKFLGWADIFSSYLNNDGVRDTALTYRGRNAKLRWRVVAHLFEGDSDGKTAGHELDLEVAYRFNRKWQATFLGSMYKTKGGISGLAASQNDLSTWTVSVSYNL